ncbi:MAG: CDGSH iron-sulfur domain-containing protein, partial [Longimicrobiales bacterium]|nr:CDGSH iron-sulfur domain-containing protein [Longimicrobiales bacterium]
GCRPPCPPQPHPTMADAKITISPNGSLKVEGTVPLQDAEGNTIPTAEDRPYFLCRCGHSARKPFCDGAHKRVGFDGTLAG